MSSLGAMPSSVSRGGRWSGCGCSSVYRDLFQPASRNAVDLRPHGRAANFQGNRRGKIRSELPCIWSRLLARLGAWSLYPPAEFRWEFFVLGVFSGSPQESGRKRESCSHLAISEYTGCRSSIGVGTPNRPGWDGGEPEARAGLERLSGEIALDKFQPREVQ